MTLCAACRVDPVAHRSLCVHCFFQLPRPTQLEYEQRSITTTRAVALLRLRRTSYATLRPGGS